MGNAGTRVCYGEGARNTGPTDTGAPAHKSEGTPRRGSRAVIRVCGSIQKRRNGKRRVQHCDRGASASRIRESLGDGSNTVIRVRKHPEV